MVSASVRLMITAAVMMAKPAFTLATGSSRPASLDERKAPIIVPATAGMNIHANSRGPSPITPVRNAGAASTYTKNPAKLSARAPARRKNAPLVASSR